MLLQLRVAVDFVGRDGPLVVALAVVDASLVGQSVGSALGVHGIDGLLQLVPAILVVEAQTLEGQLHATLVTDNLQQFVLAQACALNAFNRRHAGTLAHLVDERKHVALVVATLLDKGFGKREQHLGIAHDVEVLPVVPRVAGVGGVEVLHDVDGRERGCSTAVGSVGASASVPRHARHEQCGIEARVAALPVGEVRLVHVERAVGLLGSIVVLGGLRTVKAVVVVGQVQRAVHGFERRVPVSVELSSLIEARSFEAHGEENLRLRLAGCGEER